MTIRRSPPQGLLRFALRLPIALYRCGLGFLLGGRFLLLTHRGRVTGRERRTLLEIVRHDPAVDAYVVASGWGDRADWFRNVLEHPVVSLQVGRRMVSARAERLTPIQAEDELAAYARQHPGAFRALVRVLIGRPLPPEATLPRELAMRVPLVVFRVAG
jgi:deazaflavin-dependent oxidoreductase (nitroreductase family)